MKEFFISLAVSVTIGIFTSIIIISTLEKEYEEMYIQEQEIVTPITQEAVQSSESPKFSELANKYSVTGQAINLTEPLPCPFCGSEAYLKYYGNEAYVHCSNCCITTQFFKCSTVEKAKQEALTVWNTRKE